MSIILSLYPGIDLLGRGFELEGWEVVRGPDIIWGQRIEDFHATPNNYEGVIAGSPCQNFTTLNRTRNTSDGARLLTEFARVITEATPDWWLLENVPTVPTLNIYGYHTQRLDLRATECGLTQRRLRHFQYGSQDARPIIPDRDPAALTADHRVTLEPCCLASEGARTNRRRWSDFCALQGLPPDFDLPGWPLAFKYRAVGNGVPIPMARCLARAIATSRRTPVGAQSQQLCACDCGRLVAGRRATATSACRKRLHRRRNSATSSPPLPSRAPHGGNVTTRETVTPAWSRGSRDAKT